MPPAECVVIGVDGLDEHLPGQVSAARAARHLGQQLKRSLGGAEIRHPQSDVGGHHAHQRDVRNVVTFGDHLRADQNVEFALAKTAAGSSRNGACR